MGSQEGQGAPARRRGLGGREASGAPLCEAPLDEAVEVRAAVLLAAEARVHHCPVVHGADVCCGRVGGRVGWEAARR